MKPKAVSWGICRQICSVNAKSARDLFRQQSRPNGFIAWTIHAMSYPIANQRKEALHTQRHAHGDIRVLHHLCKLLKANFPIPIEVCFHHRFIDDL